jgi:hypothetical protein
MNIRQEWRLHGVDCDDLYDRNQPNDGGSRNERVLDKFLHGPQIVPIGYAKGEGRQERQKKQ